MKKLRGEYFDILVRKRNGDFLLDNPPLIKDYIRIKPKFGFWIADPFVIKWKETNYLFAEMCSYFTGNGFLCCLCLDEKHSKWQKIIKDKNHYSFPNVYIENNRLKLMPETSQQKAIIEYVCKDFPHDWSIENIIIKNTKSVDSIFYINADEKLLFSYEIENCNNLNIYKRQSGFYSKIATIVDPNNSLRPAGNVFLYKNKTIFPTQSNFHSYGDDISFNIIDIRDNKVQFKDSLNFSITKLLKRTKYNGAHTFNYNDEYETIDARFLKFSLLRIIGKMYRLILNPRKEHPIK